MTAQTLWSPTFTKKLAKAEIAVIAFELFTMCSLFNIAPAGLGDAIMAVR